jgi:O-antigen/teichoic acid export membrane protein
MTTASQRVFVNTIAQYARTIINMLLSLYTVRLVLAILGGSDYGIYTLLAGVVAMMSFATNSLVLTTQRFISYYQGKEDKDQLKDVFNNSLVIHIFLAVLVLVVLEAVTPLWFNGFLNIPSERIPAAKGMYQLMIVILSVTLVTSPFRALLISHENIVYISIVDILDGILKVVFVTLLARIPYDKLISYGVILLGVQLFNFLAFAGYGYMKYEECILPRLVRIKKTLIKEMLSFAGWSVYSVGCLIGRQQGIAIVLNRILGTVINAAYGIAFQISNTTGFLSSSLANAIAPQIVKAEGGGNRKRALWLSQVTCKFMFFLLSALCIPCMFEIDNILSWWLKEVPEHAGLFCIMVMCASMVDALTLGLIHINNAIGRIGWFSVMINTPKLLTFPIVFFCIKGGASLYSVVIAFVSIELLCSLLRLPFIQRRAGLNLKVFCREVFAMEILPVFICVAVCMLFVNLASFKYRFIVTLLASMAVYGISVYGFGLTKNERTIVNGVIQDVLYKTGLNRKK